MDRMHAVFHCVCMYLQVVDFRLVINSQQKQSFLVKILLAPFLAEHFLCSLSNSAYVCIIMILVVI